MLIEIKEPAVDLFILEEPYSLADAPIRNTVEVSSPTSTLMMSLSRGEVKTHIRMQPKRRSQGP